MKYYDFSCKHDILLENKDGSLLPMDEPYFEAEKIGEDTWRIFSSGDNSYLLKGDGMGLLVDSGYGAGNIREFCESVCGCPVPWIANTHEHFDHTANNGYFDMAFMSEICSLHATEPYVSFEGILFKTDYPRTLIKDHDIIPLKGRELVCLQLRDHTPGGMTYLDRKGRILYSGDEIWPNKKLNVPVQDYAADMEAINEYRNDFDILCAGERVFAGEVFDNQIINLRKAIADPLAGSVWQPEGIRNSSRVSQDGRIIYDRQFPHPGDGARGLWGDQLRKPTEYRIAETNGCRLVYPVYQ